MPSGSIVNTTESSSDSSRINPFIELMKKTTKCNGSPALRATRYIVVI